MNGLSAKNGASGLMRISSGVSNANRVNSGPKKKMVINPFKVNPQLPEGFEDKTWEKLSEAIRAVQHSQPVSTSKEELYRAVEDLCAHKMAAKLYTRLSEACDTHIAQQISTLVNRPSVHNTYLEAAAGVWSGHCEHMLTIRNIFLYLDRSFILPSPNLRSIWDLGLYQFRTHMHAAPDVESKLVSGLLALISAERDGETVNRELLRSLLRMMSALGVYGDLFEGPFISETKAYYEKEGRRYMEASDVPHFLCHVENRLVQESERVTHYLDTQTRKQLLNTVENALFVPHIETLLEKGFNPLMDSHRVTDLHPLYSLLRRVQALGYLKGHLGQYLRDKGTAIVMDKAADATMVQSLLDLRSKQEEVVDRAFGNDENFLRMCKESWEHLINVRDTRPAELLAKFLDVKLRGEKGVSEEEVEVILDKIMVLFRFLAGKDTFEAFFKRDLARRLLLEKSASADMERKMIDSLKRECGSAFTSKMEGMFKDVDLSRDLTSSYNDFLTNTHKPRDMDVNVYVLTQGYWPTYAVLTVNVPPQLEVHATRFKDFYTQKYQGRRLQWLHGVGQCILKTAFPLGRKELAVSELQATVLLQCFTGDAPVSLEEVATMTGIEDGELRRTLQSLSCGKVRVLLKEPKGREVEDGDTFTFNREFSHKLYRVRINTIQLKETIEENEKTHEAVFRDRQYQVDAVIVRVMKARKTLSHPLLMSELLSQLKFPAKPMDLKKRIESLIERDYLERDEDNPQMYNYLA